MILAKCSESGEITFIHFKALVIFLAPYSFLLVSILKMILVFFESLKKMSPSNKSNILHLSLML
jgi:hypothetical protein